MASVSDAHAALLRDPALQFEFTPAPATPPPTPPFWHASGSLGTDILWGVAIVVAVVVVVKVVRTWRERPRREGAGPAAPVPAAVAVPRSIAALALGDADALAAAGRFTDAAHVLLACGVAAIGRLQPALLRPADTSRDIARSPRLPEAARQAFGTIARAVELSVFGGRPVEAADYARCRAAFVQSTLAATR